MSQVSKRRKLSLQKQTYLNKSDPCELPKNTILSMFKRQNDKQTRTEQKRKDEEQTKDSGSEGDVVITSVTGLDADLCHPVSKSALSSATSSVYKGNLGKEAEIAQRLRLSGRKRQNIKEIVESESASDSDFDCSRPKRKVKAKNHKLSRSLSAQDSSKPGSPYRLRKRNTVPVVEMSDNETDNEQNTEKHVPDRIGKVESDVDAGIDTEDFKLKKKGIGETSTEDVVLLPSTGNRSRHFGSSEKRRFSVAENVKLSLKRSKSRKESHRESGHASEKDKKKVDVSKIKTCTAKDTSCSFTDVAVSGKTNSREKQRNKKPKLAKIDTATQECSKNVEMKVHHSQNSFTMNIYSALMPKQCGSKDMNVIDNESATGKHTNNKGSRNSKTSSHITWKSSKGLKDKKAGDRIAKAEIKEKTYHVDYDAAGGDGTNDALAESSEKAEYRVPYYLENFKTIMESVLDDEENARLFDDTDMKFLTTFNELEERSQKLYVRLFSRKLTWLPMSKVNYPEISDNITELVDILTTAGLLHSGKDLSDLPVVLKILSAPDLKSLAKSFHINSQGLTKPCMIEELLKKGQKSSISSMFKGGTTGTMEKTILDRAKLYMGKVCRLSDEPRAVFIRILMLFSLYSTNFDEESGGGGQNQLFQMLMVNIGRVVYPSYTVDRDRSVFQDRAALVRFETALQTEMDIQGMTERGKWSQAYEIYKQGKEAGRNVCKNKEYKKWDSDLPQFLRLYTAGSVYTRVDNQGVEILQRLKLYKEAVELLEELLGQDLYCIQYRGYWYERLAINLEAHLRSVEKSMTVIKRGLLDHTVHIGRRLALYERARKICEAPKSKYADRMKEFEHQDVLPTPEVHIEGMVISDATSVGMKYQFVMQGDTDSVTFCAVEELVLEHYKQNGYPEGLHAEGSIVSNLFVLLFWDNMFMDIPNVFYGPFQSCPLDIATQDFYLNRQQHVDDRLEWLKKASVEELNAEVGHVWSEHEGKMCAGINWEKFSGPETHQSVISCMGGPVIAGILERYVKDPRHTRSGFPDLTLWNTDTKQFKICEVKGPNDRLSYKQILWIDYLLKLGVDAEVCYVKAVGSKKLKPVVKK